MSLFFVVMVALMLLVAVAGGLFFYVYWFLIQRSVPSLSGRVTLPGLNAPVEILRDKHAVPHVYAANRADLFRAQGYLHAQERLWQMEQNRRIAHGTLAELFGEAALDADRFSRIIGFRRAAQAELDLLDDETRTSLTWYLEGVNAYIRANPGRLAAEFNLLRTQPDEWTLLDLLGFGKVMAWSLCTNWEGELTRLRLLNEMDPIRAAELDPDHQAANPLILEGVGSQEQVRMLYTAGLVMSQYEQLRGWLLDAAGGQGSNSWVLAPKRSASRRPLLCNDPHLTLAMPGVWYENHLECPELAVSGVSFPGLPGVLIGHNRQIAWGMTNAFCDVQDLYVERVHPEDPTRFAVTENGASGWEEAQIIEEEIRVRRKGVVVQRVTVTRHGPLLSDMVGDSDDASETAPLALRWTGHMPGRTMRALLRLNQAENWDDFQSALADWSCPPQNVTYADVQGNIGYILAGDLPRRTERCLGLTPVPGWSGQHEWDGLIPYTEHPQLFNPESGLIVTANNKMVGDDYPYFLGAEFFPGWRAARIEELLRKKERHTRRDMEQIQLDTGSKYAERLTPWLSLLQSDDPWEKAALNALRNWGYQMEKDSEAALVFHYTLLHLLEMVFGDKLGPAKTGYLGISDSPLFLIHSFMLRAEVKLLELIEEHQESVWYSEVATGRRRTRDELLQEALTKAVRAIRGAVGDSTRKWDWGRSHQIRYIHPLGSVRLLRGFFNRGPFPIAGDGTTPNQTRHRPTLPLGLVQVTPSFRQILEVGEWDSTQTVTTSGQSGHPLSAHYDDQITMFLEGVYHPMPWTRAAVEAQTVHHQELQPGKSGAGE